MRLCKTINCFLLHWMSMQEINKPCRRAYAISKLMISQAAINLIGFYLRSVLVHISPSNALFI